MLDAKSWDFSASYQYGEKIRLAASLATSILMPMTIGMLLKRSFLPKRPAQNGLTKLLRQHPRWFDYKNGFWMSMPALGIVITSQFMGHLFSARNKRELRENAIRETMMNAIFFFGNDLWMRLLTSGRNAMSKTKNTQTQVSRTLANNNLARRMKLKLANTAGSLYIASLILNSLTLAAAIILSNRMIQKKVEADVAALR